MDKRQPETVLRPAGILPVLFAFVLVACGSSEGGGTGGTGVTSRNLGTVTSTTGGVSVNGVTYDTRAAAVTVDKQTSDTTALRIGMVVTVDGAVDAGGVSGTADEIEYDHVLQGPIDSIDYAANRMIVLRQNIAVDANTQFEGDGFAALGASDVVEVSGLRDASGILHATFIKKELGSGTADSDVEGTITNLDANVCTFNINGLTVQCGSATLSGADALANGQQIEVTGSYTAGVMVATQIEVESPTSGVASGERIKIEGYVTAFASSEQFEVSGRQIQTSTQTQYEHGTPGDLRLNVQLSVEGVLDATGVLVASRVEFK